MIDPGAPTLIVTTADTDDASDTPEAESTPTLAAPAVAPGKNTNTKFPSVTADSEDPVSSDLLMPKPIERARGRCIPKKDAGHTTQIQRLQRKPLFPLPSPSSGRFKWIHVPFNHVGWVAQILSTISQDKGNLSLHAKVLLKHKHWSSAGRQSVAADASIDPGAAAGADADAAFIDKAAKVLMVDQLWLWIMDNQTVVTFFASKEKEENDNGLWREADLRNEIYQDINGDYANQCVDPYDFAALVVFHAIEALLERTLDRNLQVFRIFDEYISVLMSHKSIVSDNFVTIRDSRGQSIGAHYHISIIEVSLTQS